MPNKTKSRRKIAPEPSQTIYTCYRLDDESENRDPNSELDPTRWRWVDDGEIETFLLDHGTSMLDLKAILAENELYTLSNGKPCFRTQFSVRGKKLKVNYLRLWFGVYVSSEDSSFSWSEYARDVYALGYDHSNKELIEETGQRLKDIYETKLKPLRLESTFETLRTQFVEQSLVKKDNEDDQTSESEIAEGSISESNSKRPTKCGLLSKKRFNVYKTLLEDIFKGLGFDESVARAEYEMNKVEHSVVALDDKIESLRSKLESRETTSRQYCTINNLFLLWLNQDLPNLFKDRGKLLITPDLGLKFMMKVENTSICLTNREPPISKVLDGTCEYQISKRKTKELSSTKATKYLNALNQLYENQCMILNLDNGIVEGVKKLREVKAITNFEQNVRAKESSRKNKDFSYQDANMYFSQSPIQTLKDQTRHLLLEDSMVGYRNRAIICAQTMSTSRYDELTFWKWGDMAPFTYSRDLPSVSKQDINVLYILQKHKKGQQSKDPNMKLLTRHKDVDMCPISAISLYMFARFNLWGEEQLDIVKKNPKWKQRMIFRNDKSPFQGLNRETVYPQIKELFEQTGFEAHGKGVHLYRSMGSVIGVLYSLHESQIEHMGMWGSSIMFKHYEHYHSPSTAAKMGGCSSSETYFLPRANACPFKYLMENPEAQSLFDLFLPSINLSIKLDGAGSLLSHEGNENKSIKALRLIKIVFYQDLPTIHRMNPQASIFTVFTPHWDLLIDWFHYVDHCCEESSSEKSQDLQFTKSDENERITQLSNEVNNLKREMSRMNSTLECIMSHLQRTSSTTMDNEDEEKRKRQKVDNSAPPLLQCLRPLNELTVAELLEEWFVGFVSQGRYYEGLGSIETKRRQTKTSFYSSSLKTAISRRRYLVEELGRWTVRFGDKDMAIQAMENLRLEIGKGNQKCSLYALINHLKTQTKQ